MSALLVAQGLACGVDEAGRGPLAGPVVAAAVILDPQRPVGGIDDSKKLSAKTRERLAEEIRANALAWAVVRDRPTEHPASSLLAMRHAVEQLSLAPEYALIDGNRFTRGSAVSRAGGYRWRCPVRRHLRRLRFWPRRCVMRACSNCAPLPAVRVRPAHGLSYGSTSCRLARTRHQPGASPQLPPGGSASVAMKHISSRDNPAFKAIKKLAESGRERRKSGRIIAEGMHLIETYSDAYGLPEQVIVSASGAQRQEISLVARDRTVGSCGRQCLVRKLGRR